MINRYERNYILSEQSQLIEVFSSNVREFFEETEVRVEEQIEDNYTKASDSSYERCGLAKILQMFQHLSSLSRTFLY